MPTRLNKKACILYLESYLVTEKYGEGELSNTEEGIPEIRNSLVVVALVRVSVTVARLALEGILPGVAPPLLLGKSGGTRVTVHTCHQF